MPTRWAVWFGVEDDLRFLSHHDMMRLMERAAARANLPLKVSQGFNPRPRMSLVLPRPVGVASRCELLVLEFAAAPDSLSWADDLAAQFAPGLTLLKAQPLESGKAPRVRSASYEMTLEGDEAAAVAACLSGIESIQAPAAPPSHAGPLPADSPSASRRDCRPPPHEDALARLRDVKVQAGRLSFVLVGDEAGPGRPRDVLAALNLCGGASPAPPAQACAQALARLVRVGVDCPLGGPEVSNRAAAQVIPAGTSPLEPGAGGRIGES